MDKAVIGSNFSIATAEGEKFFAVRDPSGWNITGSPKYLVTWSSAEHETWDGRCPGFPFQVYVTEPANEDPNDPIFARDLLKRIKEYSHASEDDSRTRWRIRLDIHTEVQQGLFDCAGEASSEYIRRDAEGLPLVFEWGSFPTQNKKFTSDLTVIIIDSPHWRNNGGVVLQLQRLSRRLDFSSSCHNFVNLVPDMVAYRTGSMKFLVQSMKYLWRSAGGNRTERRMSHRGDEAQWSPVLYPAMDPALNEDDVSERTSEDRGLRDRRDLVDDSTENDTMVDFSTRAEAIYSSILENHSWQNNALGKFKGFGRWSYYGTSGTKVSSIWDARYGRARPKFSITLYLLRDCISVEDEALWLNLNFTRDPKSKISHYKITSHPWCLDIVRTSPLMTKAIELNKQEAIRRTAKHTASLRRAIDATLTAATRHKLPKELIDIIADMSVPPALPSYNVFPPFDSCFPNNPAHQHNLYLFSWHMNDGPSLVNSIAHEPMALDADSEMCMRLDYTPTWEMASRTLAYAIDHDYHLT